MNYKSAYEGQGEATSLTPDILLYRSVIVRAMLDALEVDIHAWGNTRQQIVQDARSWFSKNNPYFCRICDYANLEPTFIIRKFQQLDKANAKKVFENKNLNKFLTHYICSFHQEVQY